MRMHYGKLAEGIDYDEQWAGMGDSKIFESAHHFRIELNQNGRFEFESNLKASQVPTNKVNSLPYVFK